MDIGGCKNKAHPNLYYYYYYNCIVITLYSYVESVLCASSDYQLYTSTNRKEKVIGRVASLLKNHPVDWVVFFKCSISQQNKTKRMGKY